MRLLLDKSLADRLDEALTKEGAAYVDAWALAYPETGAEMRWVGGGCALFTGIDSPVTQTIGLGRERPVTPTDLDDVEAFFAERGAVTRVNLSPFAHPSLAAELGRRGYRVEEFENVMVRAVSSSDEFVGSAPDGIEVGPLRVEESEEWALAVARGFASASPETVPSEAELRLARLTPSIADVTAFAASAEGRPVAGGSLSMHDGVATMFGDATLLGWRGRGAQTELLRERLRTASLAGCDVATAGASPGSVSQHNMERLGFRVAYTQVMMVRDRGDRSEVAAGASGVMRAALARGDTRC